MTLPGNAAIPASDSRRLVLAELSGRRAVELALAGGPTPSGIMTAEAFDNAIRADMAIGGSTNAIIHLVAIAGRLGLALPLARFDALSRSTPLLVNDKLYTCLGRNVVVALDPQTGRELWRADPQLNAKGLYFATCRGVAYVDAPQAGECKRRILWGTADMRLLAVDAETGRKCGSFGDHGSVDLTPGMGELEPGDAMITSPPTIVNGGLS